MCSSDLTPAVELGEGQIAVQLNLQTTDFTVEETRSATPIDLQIENPMYNLWLLHYNEEGGLVESDTKYIHLNDKGELATNYTATLTLTDGNQGTLCLIAILKEQAVAIILQLPILLAMTMVHGQKHCNYYRKNF